METKTERIRVYHKKGGRKGREVTLKTCKRDSCTNLIQRKKYKRGRISANHYDQQNYCSPECRSYVRRNEQPIENRKCAFSGCKKILRRKHYKGFKIEDIKTFNRRQYCNHECFHKTRRKTQYNKVWKRCWHCTTKFFRGNLRLHDWRIKKFCDIECYRLYCQDHEGHARKLMLKGKFPCMFCNVDKPKIELMMEYFK